jgi:hypothetical protein
MILLDNLLQYLLSIVMISLSRTYDTTIILICNTLVMFMIYLRIKIKQKVIIFLTSFTRGGRWRTSENERIVLCIGF